MTQSKAPDGPGWDQGTGEGGSQTLGIDSVRVAAGSEPVGAFGCENKVTNTIRLK